MTGSIVLGRRASPKARVLAAELLRVTGDHEAAIAAFSEAARAGNSDAMFNLGNQYAGSGDNRQAVLWYVRCGEAGDPDGYFNASNSMVMLGELQNAGLLLRAAAEAGHPIAQTMLDAVRKSPPYTNPK